MKFSLDNFEKICYNYIKVGDNMDYYDGTKLLSLSDINGNKPEIFICTGNRTAGKTTYFNRLLVNRFLKNKSKFILIYRYGYELKGSAEKFFDDIRTLFFRDHYMTEESCAKGAYFKLKIDDCVCGYSVALNNSDVIKKHSHIFNDVECMLFDEFQSEANKYCPDEIQKFISIHTSIARGQGQQVRYVPVYMLSNTVTIINPYFVELGISNRLQTDTKFLRGDGFVLEQTFNVSASNAQLNSGFNKAFANNAYVGYAAQNVYLNDCTAFIEKPIGKPRYLCTLKYENRIFSIKEYADLGIVYCDDSADSTFPMKISVTTDDHQVNYVMLKRNDMFIANMRFLFEHGCFRFKNMLCKEAVLKALAY